MVRNYFVLFFIGWFSFSSSLIPGQSGSGSVRGRVMDNAGRPIAGATIMLERTLMGAAASASGDFVINGIKQGEYVLIFSAIGYKKQTRPVTVDNGELIVEIRLAEEAVETGEVLIKGKSEAQNLREQGYSVEVIESRKLKNLSKDINYVLKTAPGINIRETGGLGSGFKLSLNGLSGNQVRYFIDGVPMENFGSALSLNNYPVNLIEKLEVYKGVVPISLGSDALGGAVNIITDFWQTTFLDLAYSYASFNTSRASFYGQYASSRLGIFLKGAFFYNHSDNNYWIENAPVYDLQLGNYITSKRVRRFHDEYTSAMMQGEAGVFNKPWADKFSLKVIASKGRKNYQHPDNNINRVFGDFHTKNNSMLFAASYEIKSGNLGLKLYTMAGNINESVVDTSRRKYNWQGNFMERSSSDIKGELLERRSNMEFSDAVIRSNIGLNYLLTANHSLSMSITQNYLNRKGDDKADEFNRSYESPNYVHKNMLGLSYNIKSGEGLLEAAIFGKEYWYSGKIVTFDYEDKELVSEPVLNKTGYGLMASYHFTGDLLVKSSFEKAYRIPDSFEILGDGIYVNPNPALQPEKSYNINLGLMYRKSLENFQVKTEANLFYRLSEDFIRFNPLGPFGQYENLNNVGTEGMEAALDITYNELISFNTNFTYQNITDQTRTDEGLPNKNYKSRVPNIPYLFANAAAGFSPGSKSAAGRFQVYFNLRYVHEFFLTWEKLGDKREKNIIPSQLTQDIQFEYSMYDGVYNISLSVNNLWDKITYDNFSIQKPGRSFAMKLRYFIK